MNIDDIKDMKFLIMGCGSIGKRHLKNLQSLGISKLAAIDIDDSKRKDVEIKFGVKTFPDLEVALSEGADVALICTPTKYHTPNAIQAAKSGCHLFIEKPISDTLDNINELANEIDKRRLVCFIGCNFRFDSGLIYVKNMINQKTIGRIISVRSQFGQNLPSWHPLEDYKKNYSARKDLGGGVLLDRIHEINYLRWLFGEIDEIYALIGHLSQLEIDTEDTCEMLVKFRSGIFGSIHLDYIRPIYDCSLEIMGENGIIQWSFQDHRVHWYNNEEQKWKCKQWDNYDLNQMYIEEMIYFLEIIQGKKNNEMPLDQGIEDLKVIILAKKSSTEEKLYKLSSFEEQIITCQKNKPRILAIIQARMGSTRLPGKTLADIAGKPLLEHIINRVKASKTINGIVVATTNQPEDKPIYELASALGVKCYLGNSEDVLDRFYQAAKQTLADIIVRITADDPFKDPVVIDIITSYLITNRELDYVSNTIEPTYPEGLDVEAFRFGALERAWKEAKLPSEREHVTPYIWKNQDKFRIYNIKNDIDISHFRWTIDYYEDLCFAREIYNRLSNKGIFLMQDILEILQAESDLTRINANIERNIGYKLSIKKDNINIKLEVGEI